jgi:hypothetical protein
MKKLPKPPSQRPNRSWSRYSYDRLYDMEKHALFLGWKVSRITKPYRHTINLTEPSA